MLIPPVSASLQTCFSVLCLHTPSYKSKIAQVDISQTDQLQQKVGVRFYSMWYYIQPGVSILTRKSGLTLNLHALSNQLHFLMLF